MIYEIRFPNGNSYEVSTDLLICKGLGLAMGCAAASWAGSVVASSTAVGGLTKVLAMAGVGTAVGGAVDEAATVAIAKSMLGYRAMSEKILSSLGATVNTETATEEG